MFRLFFWVRAQAMSIYVHIRFVWFSKIAHQKKRIKIPLKSWRNCCNQLLKISVFSFVNSSWMINWIPIVNAIVWIYQSVVENAPAIHVYAPPCGFDVFFLILNLKFQYKLIRNRCWFIIWICACMCWLSPFHFKNWKDEKTIWNDEE